MPQQTNGHNFTMRNLLKTHQRTVTVEAAVFSDAPITASSWDVSTDSLICAFGPSEGEGLIELMRVTVSQKYYLGWGWPLMRKGRRQVEAIRQ